MTNLEYCKDEFVYMLNDNAYQPPLCNYFEEIWTYSDCACCPFCTKDETVCDYQKFVGWLLEEHKEPIKLKQWEKDLIEAYQEQLGVDHAFCSNYILEELKERGHFKGVMDTSMNTQIILENCEVIE